MKVWGCSQGTEKLGQNKEQSGKGKEGGTIRLTAGLKLWPLAPGKVLGPSCVPHAGPLRCTVVRLSRDEDACGLIWVTGLIPMCGPQTLFTHLPEGPTPGLWPILFPM